MIIRAIIFGLSLKKSIFWSIFWSKFGYFEVKIGLVQNSNWKVKKKLVKWNAIEMDELRWRRIWRRYRRVFLGNRWWAGRKRAFRRTFWGRRWWACPDGPFPRCRTSRSAALSVFCTCNWVLAFRSSTNQFISFITTVVNHQLFLSHLTKSSNYQIIHTNHNSYSLKIHQYQ